MPPRRRRAGYQPSELSEQIRDAIAAEAVRLEALDDDLAIIRATSEVFNALEDAILEIGEPRLRAIARLRVGQHAHLAEPHVGRTPQRPPRGARPELGRRRAAPPA